MAAESGPGFGRDQDRTQGLVRSGEVERCEGRAAALSPLKSMMGVAGKIRTMLEVSKNRVLPILLLDLGALRGL